MYLTACYFRYINIATFINGILCVSDYAICSTFPGNHLQGIEPEAEAEAEAGRPVKSAPLVLCRAYLRGCVRRSEKERKRGGSPLWGIQRGRARTERQWVSRNREAANRSAKARKFYRRRKTVRPCVPRAYAVAMPLLLVSQATKFERKRESALERSVQFYL